MFTYIQLSASVINNIRNHDMWRSFDTLPRWMQNPEVKHYYEILDKKKFSRTVKRSFDFFVSLFMLILFLPLFIVVAILIKKDSKGPVFFRQERITTYGKKFRIHKFRTMVDNADKMGAAVTTDHDMRITKTGEFLRKYRIDEMPQLIDVLKGDMSFVGTRPEATEYVKHYTKEMRATLLMPAGITSRTSIEYKDEAKLLENAADADEVYINQILPAKMKLNLEELEHFSFIEDIKIMIMTVFSVLR